MTIREIERKLFGQPLSDTIANLSHDRRLERVWQLIESRYDDPGLSLEEAATASAIGKNHLNVLLRQATACTFHQLLIRFRLLKAINMMGAESHSLLYIALENGFGSLNAFERDFRRLIGTTPKEIRAKWGER